MLVSIITPMYNAEKNIKETILSVQKQEYQQWEMIIVNDASTDNSKQIVEKFEKRDARIKLISLDKNSGIANARNMGIQMANGKYIAFLDSDDLWTDNKLSIQLEYMKNNDYEFTFTGSTYIDEFGNILSQYRKVPLKVTYKKLLKCNVIQCSSVIIDREKITDLKMPNLKHEDFATWLNILRSGYKAYGVDKKLLLYRKSNSSVSSNKVKTLKWTWNIYRKSQGFNILKSLFYWCCFVYRTSLKYIIKQ